MTAKKGTPSFPYPHLTVATIIKKDNQYLMVHEYSKSQAEMVLNQPAGHVEPNETLQQAAIRETLEETGWKVELTYLVGIYHYHAQTNGTHYCRVCFAAKLTEQVSDMPLDSDIDEALWLSEADLSMYTLRSSLVSQCINDYNSGQEFPLSLCKNSIF